MLEALLTQDLSGITTVDDVRSLATDLEVPANLRRQLSTGFTIHGAGSLGKYLAESAVRAGLPLLAVTDSNPAKWGELIAGVRVETPDCMRGTTVVSAYHVTAVLDALGASGASDLQSYYHLLLAFPEVFLPYWCLPQPNQIRQFLGSPMVDEAVARIDEPQSRMEFARQLAARAYIGVLDGKTPFGVADDEYFQGALATIQEQEVLLDIGAFDGDTAGRFLGLAPDSCRAIAVEPDLANFLKLRSVADGFGDRLIPVHGAVSDRPGLLGLAEDASVSSQVSANSSRMVTAITVDALFEALPFTRVKIDIEGYEAYALGGAELTIRERRADWAISAYHRNDDLFSLQRFFPPGYRLQVSSHAPRPWDSTIYLVRN